MPMPGYSVSLEALSRLAQQGGDGGLAPGTTGAGFRIRYQLPGFDQTGLQQRNETQSHRGGITTGISHQTGLADRIHHVVDAIDHER